MIRSASVIVYLGIRSHFRTTQVEMKIISVHRHPVFPIAPLEQVEEFQPVFAHFRFGYRDDMARRVKPKRL